MPRDPEGSSLFRCLFFAAAIAVVGFFLIFHRRQVNTVLLILLLVYGVGVGQRLLTSPDTDDLSSVALALAGLGVLWLVGWLSIRFYERRRQ